MQKQVCLMVELGLGFDANMKVMHRKIAHKEIKHKSIYICSPSAGANQRTVVCQILQWSMCNLQTVEAQGIEADLY